MGDRHRKDRYGETWDPDRIAEGLRAVDGMRGLVTLSGGWAWHFLSPEGHVELKHAHDHKDIDVFVDPPDVWLAIERLNRLGFSRVPTRHDGKTAEEFRRFERIVAHPHAEGTIKVVVDFFVREVPRRTIRGYRVVEPETLLSYYRSGMHTSDTCFAVAAARKLLAAGIDPQGRPELVTIPTEGR